VSGLLYCSRFIDVKGGGPDTTIIRYQECSMTFEHLTLVGQRLAGIRSQGNILAIRGLRSTNRVPAILAEGANSMLSLLDSTLAGGSPEPPAIRADGGV
jgi:hypothetical protein